jgi:ribosomal protein S6--L-glutamate ligase
MSLSIAIVGAERGWHVGRLREAAVRRGHRPTVVSWESFGTEVVALEATGSNGTERFTPPPLAEAELILVRGMPAAHLRDRPGGGLEEILFRMNLLGRLEWAGRRIVNRPRSLEIAIDKHLSLAMLAQAGLPVPRTILAQTPERIREAWRTLGRNAVVKPLFGSGGGGLARLTSEADLSRFLAAHPPGGVVFLQAFVPHPGWDVRALVIGDSIHAMRRIAREGEWRTNLTLGGRGEAIDLPDAWGDLALRASRVIGTDIAGVDLLPLPDGQATVCEVNAVPGWRGLAAALGIDPADEVVKFLER